VCSGLGHRRSASVRPFADRFDTKLKTRIFTTLLLCTAGLLSAGLPLHAQDDAPPTATAVAKDAPADPFPNDGPAKPAPATAALQPGKDVAVNQPAAPTIDATAKPNLDDTDGIAATVNDESISDYELRQRVALFVATSGLTPTAQDMKRIRSQMLEKMEDEKIQLQEAVKKHVTVSPVEVDKSVNGLLAQNHLTIEQLRTILTTAGASELALRSQITAQIAWQKTVQEEYSDRINISQTQVDAEFQRYADGANKPHFLVAEIFLPVSSPEKDAGVLANAQNIESQITAGAAFQAIAHQFSQNPAAAQGGSIGWVHEGQLAPELNAALVKMTPNTVSPPIRSAGGYYILQLQGRQEPMGTKIADISTGASNPDGTLALARLLLPLGASPTKELVDAGMQGANNIRNAFSGCPNLKSMSDKMKGTVYMDLGNMKPAELSPEIQKALAQTHPGEIAPPIISDAGIELIARCDKKVEVQTAYVVPTREQVEEELFNQQISALAQRYMRDLKRDADVEVR
jgi:peptidyl-prolyl cis-trans isomerase SurA